MRRLISLFIVILICGGQVWADCKSDCQEDYQSEVNSCRSQFSDRDDAEDLAACINDARGEYESCLEECETEANSTDVRVAGIDDPWAQRSVIHNERLRERIQ